MIRTATPTATLAPPAAPAAPLTFDERLALAALKVDAHIDSRPPALLDLADVIRIPVEAPEPTTLVPVLSPLAACLRRAHARLEAGWCAGALRDEQGAMCLIGAIRIAATSRGQADDACTLLLDTIRRQFPHAETVPSWNDQQTNAGPALRMLDHAANHAASRGI